MKTCPICKARCFDDMEICYGCMHPFGPEEDADEEPVSEADTPELVDGVLDRFAETLSCAISQLEPVEGPIAIATLGNGYRLVLGIEHE